MSDALTEAARLERLRAQSESARIARRREAPERKPLRLPIATARLDYAHKALERALDALSDALEDMALARVLELSRRYPTREVSFCCAMGVVDLEVSRRGDAKGMNAHKLEDDPLMKAFEAVSDDYKFGFLPVRFITARGGQIVSNLSDW